MVFRIHLDYRKLDKNRQYDEAYEDDDDDDADADGLLPDPTHSLYINIR